MKEFRNPQNVHKPLGSYSHQIEITGNERMLILSGQVGMREDGSVPEDPLEQIDVALENIFRNLRAASMDVKDVSWRPRRRERSSRRHHPTRPDWKNHDADTVDGNRCMPRVGGVPPDPVGGKPSRTGIALLRPAVCRPDGNFLLRRDLLPGHHG